MVNEPEKKKQARNDIVWQAIAPMIVIVFLAFAIGTLVGYANTPENQMAIILSSIAIGLALAIFVIQQTQSGKLNEIVDNMNKVTKDTKEIISERKTRDDDITEYIHRQLAKKLTDIMLLIKLCQINYKILQEPKANPTTIDEAKFEINKSVKKIISHVKTESSHLELIKYVGVEPSLEYNEFIQLCNSLSAYEKMILRKLWKVLMKFLKRRGA